MDNFRLILVCISILLCLSLAASAFTTFAQPVETGYVQSFFSRRIMLHVAAIVICQIELLVLGYRELLNRNR